MRYIKRITSLAALIMFILVFSTVAFASGGEFRISGDIHVLEGEIKSGDIVAIGGSITVDGIVNGDVVAIGGNVSVKGTIDGDVVLIGGRLSEMTGSVITGEIVEMGPGIISLGDFSNLNLNFGFNSTRWAITSLIVSMILSLLVIVIMPKKIENMANYLPKKPGKVVLTGLVGVLAFPFLLIICILSIILLIGLLLTPLLIVAYVVIGYIGNVAVSVFVGKRLSTLMNKENLPLPVQMIIGLIVLWGARNVPIIGFWISFALLFVTLGLVLASSFGRAIKPVSPETPPADSI